MNWTKFDAEAMELEFNERKLAAHDIEVYEAAEVIWNGFLPVRDKDHEDRYLLRGRTDSGRALELVAVVLGRTNCVSSQGGRYENTAESHSDR